MNEFGRKRNRELPLAECERRMRERVEGAIKSGEYPSRASFAIAIDQQGAPLLATRMLPPAKGLFSAVGGRISSEDEIQDLYLWSLRRREMVPERSVGQAAIMREVYDELYGEQKDVGRFHQRGHGGKDPRYHAVIYDYQTNVYCLFFEVHLPKKELNPDFSQIGEIRKLADIPLDRINPLTQLALYNMDFIDRVVADADYGQIEHICLKGGGPRTLREGMENRDKVYSHTWHSAGPQPAYFLDYKRKI